MIPPKSAFILRFNNQTSTGKRDDKVSHSAPAQPIKRTSFYCASKGPNNDNQHRRHGLNYVTPEAADHSHSCYSCRPSAAWLTRPFPFASNFWGTFIQSNKQQFRMMYRPFSGSSSVSIELRANSEPVIFLLHSTLGSKLSLAFGRWHTKLSHINSMRQKKSVCNPQIYHLLCTLVQP